MKQTSFLVHFYEGDSIEVYTFSAIEAVILAVAEKIRAGKPRLVKQVEYLDERIGSCSWKEVSIREWQNTTLGEL